MTSYTHKKDDTKLLLGVAGFVVAGAVGLALLAGASARHDADGTVARSESAQPQVSSAVTPAVRPALSDGDRSAEVFPAMREVKPPGTVDRAVESSGAAPEPALEPPVTPAIVVDPQANLLQVATDAYASREFEKAAAYLEAEIAARPERAWSHYMLGLARWKSGEPAAAAESMHRAAELNDTSIKTWVNLARIENDRGEFESALGAVERAEAIDPDSPTALFLRGRTLNNLGRTEDALAALRRSLELDVDNGFVHNLIGWIELRRGSDVAALAALGRAAELEPDVAYIRNNLGQALELNGRSAEAVEAYAAATRIDPGHRRAVASLVRLRETLPGSFAPVQAVPENAASETAPETGEAAEVAVRDSVAGSADAGI